VTFRVIDSQGNVVPDRMDYGPFGENLRAAIKFPTEQFAQLARDAESGQDYAQARNYSAGTGRFNRVDPVYGSLLTRNSGIDTPMSVITPCASSTPRGVLRKMASASSLQAIRTAMAVRVMYLRAFRTAPTAIVGLCTTYP
jgi:RHS repeat-associated protein